MSGAAVNKVNMGLAIQSFYGHYTYLLIFSGKNTDMKLMLALSAQCFDNSLQQDILSQIVTQGTCWSRVRVPGQLRPLQGPHNRWYASASCQTCPWKRLPQVPLHLCHLGIWSDWHQSLWPCHTPGPTEHTHTMIRWMTYT